MDYFNEIFVNHRSNLCTFYSSNGGFCEEKQFVQIVRHISLTLCHTERLLNVLVHTFDYALFSLFTQKSIFLLQLLLLFATAADFSSSCSCSLPTLEFSVRYYFEVYGVFSFPVCIHIKHGKIIFRALDARTDANEQTTTTLVWTRGMKMPTTKSLTHHLI